MPLQRKAKFSLRTKKRFMFMFEVLGVAAALLVFSAEMAVIIMAYGPDQVDSFFAFGG